MKKDTNKNLRLILASFVLSAIFMIIIMAALVVAAFHNKDRIFDFLTTQYKEYSSNELFSNNEKGSKEESGLVKEEITATSE